MKTTLLKSPAKINLTLKVLNFNKKLMKHKLSSKVFLIKLSDTIKVSKSKNLSIKYYLNKKKITVNNDIIKKTLIYFDKKYKTSSKFAISINKKIPIGYGLGGGSSNSASILKFMYNFYNIDKKKFYTDAPKIGSDVLIFNDNYPKLIDGLNKLKKINTNKPRWKKIFLLIPLKKNLTNKIFDIYRKNKNMNLYKNLSKNDLLYSSMIFNKEFHHLYNFIVAKKDKFKVMGMSGSGSSIFFTLKSNITEKSLINDIRSKYPLVRIEKSYYFS